MTPMSTPEGIHAEPEVVIPIVLVAFALMIAAFLLRGFLVDVIDGPVDIWRTYGPVAARRALDHRSGLQDLPWICSDCRSYNGVAATRCYKCDARREDAEAAFPDADIPSGSSAGLTQRTRTKG